MEGGVYVYVSVVSESLYLIRENSSSKGSFNKCAK
jgi:hypothetical protein